MTFTLTMHVQVVWFDWKWKSNNWTLIETRMNSFGEFRFTDDSVVWMGCQRTVKISIEIQFIWDLVVNRIWVDYWCLFLMCRKVSYSN